MVSWHETKPSLLNVIVLKKQLTLVHGVLLQDNACPHVAQRTMLTPSALGYEALPHPAYFLDLSPTDYHLLCHLDHFLSGKQFMTDNAVQHAVDNFFGSKSQDFIHSRIMALLDRWQLRVDAEGNYFALVVILFSYRHPSVTVLFQIFHSH